MKVNEKLSMLLMLEKSKGSKDGKVPIKVRLTIDSKRAELSLGMKIAPDKWNQDAGIAVGNSTEARQINTAIYRLRDTLIRHYDVLSTQHEYVSAAMVKEAYKGVKPKESKMLSETIDFMIEKMDRKVKKGKLAKSTLSKWKTTKKKLTEFLAFEYKLQDIALDKIVYAFAEDFADFLMLEQGLVNNSAMKYVKNAKKVLRTAVDRV